MHQLRVAGKYASLAKPESDRMWSLVTKATKDANTKTKLEAYQIYYQGMHSVLKKHGISLFSMFGGTLIQIPVFVTFVLTMRRMIRDPQLAHDLSYGGTLWFENLTQPDATMILPLAAIGLTYTNLQVSLGNAPQGSWMYWLKDIGQVLLILGLPLTSGLPQGVFVYWTTSASFSAVQTQVLRADSVRIGLGLPPIKDRGMPTPVKYSK
jgi:YidC/Oxa1 family membrane protein insertase